MVEIKQGKYICQECQAVNDIEYNKALELVNNVKHETRHCHSCGAKYKKIGGTLELFRKAKYNANIIQKEKKQDYVNPQQNSSDNEEDQSPIALFVIAGLFALGGVFYVIDYFKEDNKSPTSISNNVATEENSQQMISPSPKQYIEEKKCDYTSARRKALLKLQNEGLSYVGDDNGGAEEDNLNCQIRYRFFVKKLNYDLNGNQYLEDKVQLAFLTYRLIGNSYEYVDGQLMEGINSTRYRSIN
ncbi:MAG: hypothetical protein EOO43_21760 [Flavobacterium sp.]|nr:MAG: hypothetical protein EOO43_21760 [Flavobacterium sp.]